MEEQNKHSDDLPGGDVGSEEKPSLLRRLESHIGRRLGSGFLLLVPLLITVIILRFGFTYVDNLFRPLAEGTPLDFTGIGVIITLVLFYVIGAFFAGKRSQALQDAVLSRIPLVRSIYGVARQATDALSSSTGHHFSRVVFVEWPRPGVRAMGFVTGHMIDVKDGRSWLVAVYIPTVPNPTSGMLAFFSEDDVIDSNITVQDAMKMVFSGGIVLPQVPPNLGLRASLQVDDEPDG